MNGERAKSTLFLLISCLITLWAGHAVWRFWLPASSTAYQTKTFEVLPSTSAREVTESLEAMGIVRGSKLFRWYGRITGDRARIKAGEYRFHTRMTPAEVYAVLVSGVSIGRPVAVPEGYNISQIADVVEEAIPGGRAEFLKVVTDKKFIQLLWTEFPLAGGSPAPTTLEGYLFPSTYFISKSASLGPAVKELVRSMVKAYRSAFGYAELQRAQALGMTEHQLITLASIVEKETGAKVERPLVSSVFHNRLKKKMRLQSDPTVIYGIRNYDGNIHRRDLDNKTPYNTYQIPALPIGPIANPGREAINATLYPQESEYLYFVSRNDGTHHFSATYAEHDAHVKKLQVDPKAREGKSWRDLKQ